MKRTCFGVGTAIIICLLAPALANACNDLLNTIVFQRVRPVVESADLCRGLPVTDKTDQVRLTQFKYCAQEAVSTLKANVFVRCKTSDHAVIRIKVQEDFTLEATIENASCRITGFHASPRGDIGRLIARNTGFKERVRNSMQNNLNLICGN